MVFAELGASGGTPPRAASSGGALGTLAAARRGSRVSERSDQGGDQVGRCLPLAVGVGRDHPLLAVGVDDDRVAVELAMRVELLLSEPECRTEEAVEVVFRMLRGGVASGRHIVSCLGL